MRMDSRILPVAIPAMAAMPGCRASFTALPPNPPAPDLERSPHLSLETQNAAPLGAAVPADQVQQRGLAAAVGADDADEAAGGQFQGEPVEDRFARVGEGDAAQREPHGQNPPPPVWRRRNR